MARKQTTGFAARLRELRLAAGLTQVELAERAGLHLHGLTKLEQGDREPSWATAVTLANALHVDIGAFLPTGPAAEARRPRGRPARPDARQGETTAKKTRRRKG